MWMIEYSCKIPLEIVNSIIPDDLQEHITILDLKDIKDNKIQRMIQRFYDNGFWIHRYFTNTEEQAKKFIKERHNTEAWNYLIKYLEFKKHPINYPKVQEYTITLDDTGVKYYS